MSGLYNWITRNYSKNMYKNTNTKVLEKSTITARQSCVNARDEVNNGN